MQKEKVSHSCGNYINKTKGYYVSAQSACQYGEHAGGDIKSHPGQCLVLHAVKTMAINSTT